MKIQSSKGQYEISFTGLSQAMGMLPPESVIVTDENVFAAHGDKIPESVSTIQVPAGEETKSIHWFGYLHEKLAESKVQRKQFLVALGGGVIGDLVGFVAATYMRGIRLIQIPTTLLSQVDSSVGGKTGIDLPQGKNLVGAFYPPEQVFICPDCLDTLPERQFINGCAEVWKYGWIMDEALLSQLESQPLRQSDSVDAVIHRCVELKATIVAEDEFETTGRRAILNFGHTIGHALEQVTQYGPYLHGEAISIGMVAETKLAEQLGICPAGLSNRVESGLQSQGLPTTMPADISAEGLIEAMRRDKKVLGSHLAFSLVTGRGACKLFTDVPEEAVRKAITDS